MPIHAQTKDREEWGKEESSLAPKLFLPPSKPPATISSSWNLCFGWRDIDENKTLGRSPIRILRERDCAYTYLLTITPV